MNNEYVSYGLTEECHKRLMCFITSKGVMKVYKELNDLAEAYYLNDSEELTFPIKVKIDECDVKRDVFPNIYDLNIEITKEDVEEVKRYESLKYPQCNKFISLKEFFDCAGARVMNYIEVLLINTSKIVTNEYNFSIGTGCGVGYVSVDPQGNISVCDDSYGLELTVDSPEVDKYLIYIPIF